MRAAFEILERDRTADWKSIQELSRWKDDIARRDRDIERKDQEIVIKDHEMDMQRQEFSNYRMAAEATEQRVSLLIATSLFNLLLSSSNSKI